MTASRLFFVGLLSFKWNGTGDFTENAVSVFSLRHVPKLPYPGFIFNSKKQKKFRMSSRKLCANISHLRKPETQVWEENSRNICLC